MSDALYIAITQRVWGNVISGVAYWRLGRAVFKHIMFKRCETVIDGPVHFARSIVLKDTNQFIGNHVGWLGIYIIHNTIQASKIYIYIYTYINKCELV